VRFLQRELAAGIYARWDGFVSRCHAGSACFPTLKLLNSESFERLQIRVRKSRGGLLDLGQTSALRSLAEDPDSILRLKSIVLLFWTSDHPVQESESPVDILSSPLTIAPSPAEVPTIGDLSVGGITLGQLKEDIEARVGEPSKRLISSEVSFVSYQADSLRVSYRNRDAVIVYGRTRLRRDLEKLSGQGKVFCCYEASSAGFVLWRKMREWGISCQIAAPSLIPKKAGLKRKNDRLDARHLAEYYQSGLLTLIHVPSEDEEAVRDLLRCRFQISADLKRAKNRTVGLLRRRGQVYPQGKSLWTKGFVDWANGVTMESKADQLTLTSYLEIVDFLNKRVQEKDQQIAEFSISASETLPSGNLTRTLVGSAVRRN
jgi:hypothetical protein